MVGDFFGLKFRQGHFLDLILNNIRVLFEEDDVDQYITAASAQLSVDKELLSLIRILSKELDFRNEEQFYYKLSIAVRVNDESFVNRKKFSLYFDPTIALKKPIATTERPIVVGFGPAGMFAALELLKYGLKPIIFERGKTIGQRSADVQKFINERKLNPESNIQFGEGGAGSYSDGKLFSRRHNNTSYVSQVLDTFVEFGAPKEIGYISKPHLGTDVLCKIVRNIRNYVLEQGGEIHYSSKMTDIIMSDGKVAGIIVNDEKEYLSTAIFVATGHSARDTYRMFKRKNIALEQRQISVGIRIEHPVETIDLIRYGKKYCGHSRLGAATYSLNYTNKKIRRGVYTFCMCPGGEVVNASSEDGHMVVNGMSYSRRSSPYSNSAMVVSCHTSDFPSMDVLAGLNFQQEIESKAFHAGGSDWHVPAQNLMDFLADRESTTLNDNSFKMGVVSADMRAIMPQFVIKELKTAFHKWKEEIPLFISDRAILMGAETRTSSPVRVTRNEKYQSINCEHIYPIGEGSGYTGGITSSAADAIRAVERYAQGR